MDSRTGGRSLSKGEKLLRATQDVVESLDHLPPEGTQHIKLFEGETTMVAFITIPFRMHLKYSYFEVR